MTIQEEIDKLLKLIEDNRKLMAIPKIFIDKNTDIKVEFIPESIPNDATPFEETAIETINMLRKLQRCSKCNPDEGGMQVLDWETGKWNCVIHKN